MKTQNLLFKISRTKVTRFLFAGALLFGSSAAFAQVKIGTNPTTIEPNSNLEVEASTPGRKMKVDKTTGQVTITDAPEKYLPPMPMVAEVGRRAGPGVPALMRVGAVQPRR
jgi:hypothetical protein